MSDIAAAREHIQKAVSFLVNRFGSQEIVFRHLTDALAMLQDDPLPREPTPPVVEEPPAEAETEITVAAEEEAVFVPVSKEATEVEPEPEVKPPVRRQRRSK